MRQEFRLILAVVLSAAVFYVYYAFINPPIPLEQKPAVTQVANTSKTAPVPSLKTEAENNTNKDTADLNILTESETQVAAENITIDMPTASVVLSTQGGVLTSYELKDYHREAKEHSPTKNLLTEAPNSTSLFVGFKGFSRFNSNKVFKVIKDSTFNGCPKGIRYNRRIYIQSFDLVP